MKARITVGILRVHHHDRTLLPHMKSEKSAKISSKLPSGTNRNQPQLVTNTLARRRLRAGLRRKVPSTHTLLTPKTFSQSPEIQR